MKSLLADLEGAVAARRCARAAATTAGSTVRGLGATARTDPPGNPPRAGTGVIPPSPDTVAEGGRGDGAVNEVARGNGRGARRTPPGMARPAAAAAVAALAVGVLEGAGGR